MRISEQNAADAQFNASQRTNEQKTSGQFSRVMKQNKDRQDVKDGITKKNRRDGTAQKVDSPDVPRGDVSGLTGQRPMIPEVDGTADLQAGRPLTTDDMAKSATARETTAAHIQALAAETGAHIDRLEQSGANQTLHMTFDSKTLQGLQVQIRRQDGEVAIHFIAQSDGVSNLLKSHASELREALTSKGVKVGNIAIATTTAQSAGQRDRNA
jgi:flagellar hook-length control protein FliK